MKKKVIDFIIGFTWYQSMFKLCIRTLPRNTNNIRCLPSKSRIIVNVRQKRYYSSGNDGDETIKSVACVVSVGLVLGLTIGGDGFFKICGGLAMAAGVVVVGGVFVISCTIPMFWPVYFLLFMFVVSLSKK
jgi:hypothetical protein